MGVPGHLTCLHIQRNLHKDREPTVSTLYETTDWFKTGKKKYNKAVYCHPYLTYMQNARLGESQARIKIAGGDGTYLYL